MIVLIMDIISWKEINRMFEFWFTKYMVECFILLLFFVIFGIIYMINIKYEKKKRERFNKKLKEFKEHMND